MADCVGCDESCPVCQRLYSIGCQNGCVTGSCSNGAEPAPLIYCSRCDFISCTMCASMRGRDLPTTPATTPTLPQQQLFQCTKCDTFICEGCWIKSWSEKKEIIAQCARCKQLICNDCKPSIMEGHERVLRGCYNCPNSFCEDCYTQNTITCRRKDCTCEPRCVCDVVCFDCRAEKCRYPGITVPLSQHHLRRENSV